MSSRSDDGPPKGRPTKCTTQAILDAERIQKLGATDTMTAEYLNISRSTFKEWMRKGGIEPDSVYGHFRAAVKKGRSQGGILNLATVQAASRAGQWQAAAWLLERRYGYRDAQEIEDNSDLHGIDVQTEEGQKVALDILNQIPIDILRRIDPRRLYAASNFQEE